MKRSLLIAIIGLFSITTSTTKTIGQTGNDSIATLPEPAPMILCPSAPLPTPIQTYQEYITVIGEGTTDCPEGFDETTFRLVSESSDGMQCLETIVRTYQIADKCGITATVEHVFIKNDDQPPVSGFPYLITLECQEDVRSYPIFKTLDEFINAGGFAFDNCALDPATFIYGGGGELEGTECDGMIRRLYTIADICGNMATAEVQLRIYDHSGPRVRNYKRTLIAECNAPAPYRNIRDFRADSGVADDNDCGTITLRLLKTDTISRSCPMELVRIYELTDRCGNTTTFKQSVIVDDQISPVIENDSVMLLMNRNTSIQVLANDMVFRDRIDSSTVLIISPPEFGTATVTVDGSVIYASYADFKGFDSFTYKVCNASTYCGNMCDSATVFIEVIEDIQAPLVQGELYDLHFECMTGVPLSFSSLHDLAQAGITFTDDFAVDSTTFQVNEMAINNNCIITIVRQYSVSDMAQNTSAIEQTITVEDTQDPTLKCPPNMALSLDHPVPAKFTTLESFVTQGGSVIDNCEIDPGSFFNMSESIDTLSNSILIRRAYYVEDFCRNGDICLHQIEIETGTNSLDLSETNAFHVSVYPNPTKGEFSVKFEVTKSSSVQLEIVDINGKSVFSDTHQCAPGTNMKDISLKSITKGTYMLIAKSGVSVAVEKVVVR